MMLDFGLTKGNYFGSTSDGGSGAKWMMKQVLKLQREWYVGHMTNATTKFTFGMEPSKTSRNPEMMELVEDVQKAVRTVKEVEVMGSLFEALCQLEGKGQSTRLLDCQATASWVWHEW